MPWQNAAVLAYRVTRQIHASLAQARTGKNPQPHIAITGRDKIGIMGWSPHQSHQLPAQGGTISKHLTDNLSLRIRLYLDDELKRKQSLEDRPFISGRM